MISPPRPDGPILRYGKPYAAIARLSPDIRAFLALAEGLRALRLFDAARLRPHIADGLALIEDFGAETIADERGPDPDALRRGDGAARRSARARAAGELPIDGETYALPIYDIDAMLVEVELALDWYAPTAARVTPASGARMQFLGLWRERWRRSSPSRRPGRCATIIRPTCTGFAAARACAGSA